jgi:hypothetical protein
MRSMVQREVGFPHTVESRVTQALEGIPASRLRVEFLDLHLYQEGNASQGHRLGEWLRQDLRGLEFPFEDRDLNLIGQNIVRATPAAPNVGIVTAIAGAVRGRSDLTAMRIRDGLHIPT